MVAVIDDISKLNMFMINKDFDYLNNTYTIIHFVSIFSSSELKK
jgi:hypothetical protein